MIAHLDATDKPQLLHDLTQEGRIILINANADALGESTELYGRFWIAQAYKSVLMRLNRLEEHERMPTTFVIDEQGKIAHIFPKVKVQEHYDEVIDALKQ